MKVDAVGAKQLAESADCFRLIVVHLHRAHSFGHLRQVQDELSAFVMELAPPELDPGAQVPFLSLGAGAGGDGSVGERAERCRGRSQFSGEYVVEDVEVGGELYRRLVFMNNPNITQSEARLKTGKGPYLNDVYTIFGILDPLPPLSTFWQDP